MLSNDTDKSIRKDISHQLGRLLSELDKGRVEQHFVKIIENYIVDSDMIIRTEIILAVAGNVNKFSPEFINTEFKSHCTGYFHMDKSNLLEYFEQLKSVFFAMLGICESHKPFAEVVKAYLKKFCMIAGSGSDFISSNLPFDYVLEHSDTIIKVLQATGDENFVVEYVLYILFNVVEKEGSSFILTYEQFSEVDYKNLFYKNIHKFLTSVSKDTLNKYLLPSFFDLFKKDDHELVLIKPALKNFKEIIQHQAKVKNKDFINEFIAIFDKFETVTLAYDKCQDWRDIKNILIAVEM
jgi:hypothetical protein